MTPAKQFGLDRKYTQLRTGGKVENKKMFPDHFIIGNDWQSTRPPEIS